MLEKENIQKLTIRAEIDFVGELGDVDVEPVLDVVQGFCVVFIRNEGNGEAFGTETTGTSNAMQVGIGIFRHVVIEYDIDTFNVHSTSEKICGDKDTLLEEKFSMLLT